MNPCSRAGINLTWACNLNCKPCFYRRFPELHTATHKPLDEAKAEIDCAKARGCTHIVGIGQGEPTLYPDIVEVIKYCKALGMTSSLITNGTTGLWRYNELYNEGLDHLHISVHEIGTRLDPIVERGEAGKRQGELLVWLGQNSNPFRTNTVIQQANYKRLPQITRWCIARGAFHVVLLNFLPHYQWHDKAQEVAVSPAELRPYVEESLSEVLASGGLITLRYFPFCHLNPEYWPFVTNARYVLFDPWEWDYEKYNPDPLRVWPHAVQMGESVAIKGEPCSSCLVRLHCGGWNEAYAKAFNGARLKAITEVPKEYEAMLAIPGSIFDLNTANK